MSTTSSAINRLPKMTIIGEGIFTEAVALRLKQPAANRSMTWEFLPETKQVLLDGHVFETPNDAYDFLDATPRTDMPDFSRPSAMQ